MKLKVKSENENMLRVSDENHKRVMVQKALRGLKYVDEMIGVAITLAEVDYELRNRRMK